MGVAGQIPWNKGKKMTEAYRQRCRETSTFIKGQPAWNNGKILPADHPARRKRSEETRRKISMSKLGSKNPMFGKHHSPEERKIRSEANKGRVVSAETRRKLSESQRGENHHLFGKHLPDATRRKLSEALEGSKSPHWKGGKTSKSQKIRNSKAYIAWRKAVFERDGYTCQMCGRRGGKLNAHHKKSFADYPELRFLLDNGETLCENPCHKLTDNYGAKKLNPK